MADLPPLTDETLWAIIHGELTDDVANRLVWQGLGYRYDAERQQWDLGAVEEPWREAYPTPPDFVDSRPATVMLTRSIPPAYKQLLKEELGFKGYTIDQLTPQKTRRATIVNWLLAHRKAQNPE